MRYLDQYKLFESSKFTLQSKIDKLIEKFIKRGDVSGVNIGVFKGDSQLILQSYGMANLELDVKLKPDHVFEIASITKQFTAFCIMQLSQNNKLKLTDNITKWIEVDTKDRKITIKNLLEHTSGLGFSIPNHNLKNTITKNGRRVDLSWEPLGIKLDDLLDKKTRNRILELSKNFTPLFEPGDQQSYSNFGYFLLGLIIEKVTGKTFEDYIQKNIFDVVGMKSSFCGEVEGIVKNKVTGYERKNIGEVDELRFDKDNVLVKANVCNLNVPFGSGCISSTIEDIYKWNKALHTGKLLKEETYQEYIKPTQLNTGEVTRYAKGLNITDWYGKKLYFHAGGISGFTTMNFYFPKEEVSVIVFINTSGFGIPRYSSKFDTNLSQGLDIYISNMVSHYLFDMDIQSEYDFWGMEEVVFRGNLNDYVGTFKHNIDMTIKISKVNDRLLLNFNGAKKTVPLYYIGKNRFSEGDFIITVIDNELHLNACGGYLKFKKN